MFYRSEIRLGEWDLSKNPDCEKVNNRIKCADAHFTVYPETVVIHKNYSRRARLSDDIALVRVDRTIPFTGKF